MPFIEPACRIGGFQIDHGGQFTAHHYRRAQLGQTRAIGVLHPHCYLFAANPLKHFSVRRPAVRFLSGNKNAGAFSGDQFQQQRREMASQDFRGGQPLHVVQSAEGMQHGAHAQEETQVMHGAIGGGDVLFARCHVKRIFGAELAGFGISAA